MIKPQAALVNGQHLDFSLWAPAFRVLAPHTTRTSDFPITHSPCSKRWTASGHLVDASLPRRAFGQRLLHLRLQLQALGNRTRHRHGRRDPRLPGELIEENDLARHIHYGHKITAARWSSRDKRWTLEVTRTHSGETLTLTTGFLWMCSGYYDHARAIRPSGLACVISRQWVHPQHWPQELDCTGKRVVVIGSRHGRHLDPVLADAVAHVTMLQRSPTFSRRIPHPSAGDPAARTGAPRLRTRSCGAPSSPRWTAKFACPSNIPRKCARGSSSRRALLPEGFDVEKHFNPSYRPWQQRIALPDGDLFAAIRSGKASVVTDGIERFDATGVRLSAARILTPTSSSPRRVSTCGYSAACHFSLMANRWTSPSASAIAA